MRLHRTKEEQRRRKKAQAIKKIRALSKENLKAGDIFYHLPEVKDRDLRRYLLRLSLGIASVDDLYCFIRSGFSEKGEALKILLGKLSSDGHKRVILIQIAREDSELAEPALNALRDLELEPTCEEVDLLLQSKHIQGSESLVEALKAISKREEKRRKKIEQAIHEVLVLDKKIREPS